ncbi:spore coat protein [Metabacillus sp. KIGAM252]|uniref:Spore coat protein n=1 Tax=Metabacillus flavus TaxID=2823519 RepID=A0ABS5LD13_9BACI|nr:spore coat protein [Metabacillus flavus]MBS2968418.1 spore coat protein [Metabacillus flavus]
MSNEWSVMDEAVSQDAEQNTSLFQLSDEGIYVKNSDCVTIETTDTQLALSIQAAIQVAIALAINLTIADSARAEQVTQQLLNNTIIQQTKKQRIIVLNSENVTVKSTNTDVAISLQLLIQILLALLLQIDIL